MKTVRLGLMLWAAAALAQFPFPGQSPYPNGNPNPTGPNGRRNPQQRPEQPPQNSGRQGNRPVTAEFDGMVRRVAGNQLVIESDDYRIIWFRITAQTISNKDGAKTDVANFKPGDRVTVEASEDDEGNLTAVDVTWNREGTIAEKTAAKETWDLPGAGEIGPPAAKRGSSASGGGGDDDRPILRRQNSPDTVATPAAAPTPPAAPPAPPEAPPAATVKNPPPASQTAAAEPDDSRPTPPATQIEPPTPAPDSDDPGRPVLRRGGAAAERERASASSPAPTPPASAPPAPPAPQSGTSSSPVLVGRTGDTQSRPAATQPILPQEDPLIGKVREAAYSYSSSLPNFFCQQITTRYQSQNPRQGWQTVDLVTADVAYENGQERYKNIKVGNKSAVQSMDELGGTRSTGEFSSVLLDLMSESTGAVFRRSGADSIQGRSAVVFKLDVPREQSHWRISTASQLYYPAYRGSIWVDKDTSRVLRIELQARNIPTGFPLDTVESATDYGFIRLTPEVENLLPANAEVLSCEHGSSFCSRNRIEFHNYRKFDSASSIVFDAK